MCPFISPAPSCKRNAPDLELNLEPGQDGSFEGFATAGSPPRRACNDDFGPTATDVDPLKNPTCGTPHLENPSPTRLSRSRVTRPSLLSRAHPLWRGSPRDHPLPLSPTDLFTDPRARRRELFSATRQRARPRPRWRDSPAEGRSSGSPASRPAQLAVLGVGHESTPRSKPTHLAISSRRPTGQAGVAPR